MRRGVVLLPWAVAAQQPPRPPADDASTLELAKKTQNPIAALISLPLQNNLNFGYGAKAAPQRWTLRLQVQLLFPK